MAALVRIRVWCDRVLRCNLRKQASQAKLATWQHLCEYEYEYDGIEYFDATYESKRGKPVSRRGSSRASMSVVRSSALTQLTKASETE